MKHRISRWQWIASISVVLLLASCAPIVDTRGHTGDMSDMEQIVVGQSQQEDVRAILGSPSTTADFGGTSWYYITARKETVAFYAPEIADQHVTAIRFDDAGVVTAVDAYDKKKGKKVQFVEKTTPTAGHEITFIEQMLGNFGRFNAPGRSIDPRNLGR